MREDLMKDMQVEDDRLKPFVQKSRLEKWYQGALDLAKQDFAMEVDEETNDAKRLARAASRLREIEARIVEGERSAAEGLLHRPTPAKTKAKKQPRVSSVAGRLRSSKKH
jgi:nuclear pore complex protein Nup133